MNSRLAPALAFGLALAALPVASFARDGINGCSIAETTDDEAGPVWRYTIDLQVPEGGRCRVFIIDDNDRKTWKYCWLKAAPTGQVTDTCDDPLDDRDFDDWKAKAACGDYNSMAYCRREP